MIRVGGADFWAGMPEAESVRVGFGCLVLLGGDEAISDRLELGHDIVQRIVVDGTGI
jgi:hypothetical protein